MVEYTIDLDLIFASLADSTRRDILRRVVQKECSVGELADAYKHLSFAGVSKHIGVLEDADLVVKKRNGRYQLISANAKGIQAASSAIDRYKALWESRFNALDALLKE